MLVKFSKEWALWMARVKVRFMVAGVVGCAIRDGLGSGCTSRPSSCILLGLRALWAVGYAMC